MEVVGSESVQFWYIHYGGTNNLLPGRPEQLTYQLSVPRDAQIFTAISKMNFGFINGNDGSPPMQLNPDQLGQIGVDVWTSGSTLNCWMILNNGDATQPCTGQVDVNVLYFR